MSALDCETFAVSSACGVSSTHAAMPYHVCDGTTKCKKKTTALKREEGAWLCRSVLGCPKGLKPGLGSLKD